MAAGAASATVDALLTFKSPVPEVVRCCASLVSHLTAVCAIGPAVFPDEAVLDPWLVLGIFSGGQSVSGRDEDALPRYGI